MVLLRILIDLSRRLRHTLWTLMFLLFTLKLYSFLDSDVSVSYPFTPAIIIGLRFALVEMAAKEICCVPGCGSQNQILHKFPHPEKDPDRFRTWLYAVGGEILSLDNKYVFQYRCVCHLHFEARYHTWSKRLTRNSVPTLHLPGFSVTRRPLRETTNQATSGYQDNSKSGAFTASAHLKMTEVVSSTLDFQGQQPENLEEPSGSQLDGNKAETETPNMFLKRVNPGPQKQYAVEPKTVKTGTPNVSLKKGAAKTSSSNEVFLLKKTIEKLNKSNNSYRMRLKKASRLFENDSFQKALKKFTTMAAIFTVLQFKQMTKPKMSRRYSKEEKIMALSVYKLGPKAYRWLSKFFVLPSPVTLSRMISRANLKPGINANIFNQLKKKVDKMSDDDKLCSLIFDEMALSPHFEYNRKKDKIIGFVDDGTETTKKIADHVLVFMIRGITKNYKQPIQYTFCSGSTNKVILAKLIKEIITKLQEIGFDVVATVCDQGSSNVSAINYLIDETRRNHVRRNTILKNQVFEINDKTIIPLFDVPHLLKGIRNNLITKNLKFTLDGHEKIAKWEHITALYEKNPVYKGLKIIKNLTENHCNAAKIPKMKVKYASQLFSQTVGKTMGYLAENGLLPKECQDTADLILFMDDLFDSMNGSFKNASNRSGKELLRNITPTSKHNEFWTKAKTVLRSMKFISGKRNAAGTVPSISNWLRTVENMELLRNTLFNKYDIKSIWARHLNQDPLENFFGSIRSHGARNNSPTCAAFEAAFASLLVNNLSRNYSQGSNCEEDTCNNFKCFENLFFYENSNKNVSNENDIDVDDILNDNIIEDFNKKKEDRRIIGLLQYVAGYILRQCKNNVKTCNQCINELIDKDPKSDTYLRHREYYKNKIYLTYPNDTFVKMISEIQDISDHILKNKSHIRNLNNYIKIVLYTNVNFNWIKCKEHKSNLIEFIFNYTSRFLCFNWCRNANKLLNGTSKIAENNDVIQKHAIEYYQKRKTKKVKRTFIL